MFQLFGSVLIFKVIQYSKILSSKVETVELLRKSNQHLGPGLAKSFFRFLQILAPETGDILRSYKEDEEIGYIHPKVLIVFPKRYFNKAGSTQWMYELQRQNNPPQRYGQVEFTLVRSIHRPYLLSGRTRDMNLAVIKIRHLDSKKVYYSAVVENRPLLKLQEMSHQRCFNLRKEDFDLQVEMFRDSLKKLVENDVQCCDKFEFIDLNAKNHKDFQMKIYTKIKKE